MFYRFKLGFAQKKQKYVLIKERLYFGDVLINPYPSN